MSPRLVSPRLRKWSGIFFRVSPCAVSVSPASRSSRRGIFFYSKWQVVKSSLEFDTGQIVVDLFIFISIIGATVVFVVLPEEFFVVVSKIFFHRFSVFARTGAARVFFVKKFTRMLVRACLHPRRSRPRRWVGCSLVAPTARFRCGCLRVQVGYGLPAG